MYYIPLCIPWFAFASAMHKQLSSEHQGYVNFGDMFPRAIPAFCPVNHDTTHSSENRGKREGDRLLGLLALNTVSLAG